MALDLAGMDMFGKNAKNAPKDASIVRSVKVTNPMHESADDDDEDDGILTHHESNDQFQIVGGDSSTISLATSTQSGTLNNYSSEFGFSSQDKIITTSGGAEYLDNSDLGVSMNTDENFLSGRIGKLFAYSNVVAGAITAVHVSIYLIALALLAADPKYFSAAACLELAVMGTIILQCFNTAFGSNKHFAICNSDTLPAAVTVAVIQSIVSQIEHNHLLEQAHVALDQKTLCVEEAYCKSVAHSTILVALGFSNCITGLILFLMGQLKLGSLIAFVPLPVECAFLAGCGFKIVKTGVKFLISFDTIKEDYMTIFIVFLPAFALGIGIWLMEDYVKHKGYKNHEWFLPIALVVFTGMYYAFLGIYASIFDRSWADAWADAHYPSRNSSSLPALPHNQSWLIAPVNSDNFHHYSTFVYKHVAFDAILSLSTMVSIMVLTLVTILAVLLNSSRLEEETKKDIDFDNELKVVGISNAAAALGGGFIGFCSVQKTMLCFSTHDERYFAGVFAVVFYAWFLFQGTAIVHYLPLPVMAAFIVAIGMDYIDQWFIKLWKDISHADFIQTSFLFLLMMYDFVAGFLFGMGLSLVVFAARYSSIPVIKSTLSGVEYHGNAVRNRRHNMQLRAHGAEILVMRLQGFIFFFTAEKLRLTIMHTLLEAQAAAQRISYLVLEFAHVDNIDSTSIKKLKKLLRFTSGEKIFVVLSCVDPIMRLQFEKEGLSPSNPEFHSVLSFVEQTDLAVEWAADELLARPDLNTQMIKRNKADGKFKIREVFQSIIGFQRVGLGMLCESEPFDTTSFRRYGVERKYATGDYIIRQGSVGRTMYFLTQGIVIITVSDHHGVETRVEKRYQGTMVGETSFFLNKPRTANIIANCHDTICYEYTQAAFEKMKAERPYLAERLSQHIISKMSDIISRQAHELQILLRHKKSTDISPVAPLPNPFKIAAHAAHNVIDASKHASHTAAHAAHVAADKSKHLLHLDHPAHPTRHKDFVETLRESKQD